MVILRGRRRQLDDWGRAVEHPATTVEHEMVMSSHERKHNRERGPIADFIIALLECGYCYAMLISPFHSVGVKMYAIDWPEK